MIYSKFWISANLVYKFITGFFFNYTVLQLHVWTVQAPSTLIVKYYT